MVTGICALQETLLALARKLAESGVRHGIRVASNLVHNVLYVCMCEIALRNGTIIIGVEGNLTLTGTETGGKRDMRRPAESASNLVSYVCNRATARNRTRGGGQLGDRHILYNSHRG